ncbi:hypothetical protein ACHWQZ_G002821 [Mnemiopsis leidyi]
MTRRSARIRNLNPGFIESKGSVHIGEVTSPVQTNIEDHENDSEIELEKINSEIEDVGSSESEPEAPEEVTFEKSKKIFMEESSVIRNAIKAKRKRHVLPASVLSAVSKQIMNEGLEEKDADEDIVSSICTEEFNSVPRIRAVSLKSLHNDYDIDQKVVFDKDSQVKRKKFCKVKLGPAAQFLVNRN